MTLEMLADTHAVARISESLGAWQLSGAVSLAPT